MLRQIPTQDGSHTLYHSGLNEHYHSTHGAVQESMHVYIRAGLEGALQQKTSLSILEMGFGTGLNAWLTLVHAPQAHIQYTGLESFPLSAELALALNYGANSPQSAAFEALHAAEWEKEVPVNEHFTLKKYHTRIEDAQLPEAHFDLIYYDAFAFRVQPELWSPELMARCYAWLKPGGIWVSYCAKGLVRRGLKAAGFQVERMRGAPGKWQMLRAKKTGIPV